jgi:hypothetical protein
MPGFECFRTKIEQFINKSLILCCYFVLSVRAFFHTRGVADHWPYSKSNGTRYGCILTGTKTAFDGSRVGI